MDLRRKRFFNKWLARLNFIDETSTNTKLTKRTGWSQRGQRYRTDGPFGSWKSQTFIAGLRCHGRAAPWIVDAPMSRRISKPIETQLLPTLSPGDVVILDNVAFHKSPRAEELVKARGVWLLFLPAYSPDLNPIEMAFSKLKALPRKRAARTFDAITQALGYICELFQIEECRNFFKAVGYKAEWMQRALVMLLCKCFGHLPEGRWFGPVQEDRHLAGLTCAVRKNQRATRKTPHPH